MRDITSVMGTIETEARGVTVQASTLGKRRDSSHCLPYYVHRVLV